MKVKIMQRSVYHKFAEVEIDIDKDKLKEYTDAGASIVDYLFDNANLYEDKIEHKISNAEYEFGFGMDTGDWKDRTEESEWRYETNGEGGHL
tara:strand:+ start:3057 stop:3332 length:276 start_codon:yes stop_codon:yes gene_type:complete